MSTNIVPDLYEFANNVSAAIAEKDKELARLKAENAELQRMFNSYEQVYRSFYAKWQEEVGQTYMPSLDKLAVWLNAKIDLAFLVAKLVNFKELRDAVDRHEELLKSYGKKERV